jgi:hypothetical protein
VTAEIRVRSFGELLDGGFHVLTERFGLLVGLAAIVYAPAALIEFAAGPLEEMAGLDESTLMNAYLVRAGLSAIAVLATFPFAGAAITHAAAAHCEGRAVGFFDSLRVAAHVYLPLAGTNLLAWTLVLLGLLLVVPGVLLGLGFLVVSQVAVVERVFGPGAMRRSWRLMRGHRMRGLTLTTVLAVMGTVPPVATEFLLATLPVVGYPMTTLAYCVGLAYSIAVTVLFYFDLRCRKEAYDLQVLAAEVSACAPAAP